MTSPHSAPLVFLRRYRDVIALAAAAAFLRFSSLSDWWLNPDEGIYYSVLTRSNPEGFWQEVLGNAHPPLYYLLVRAFGWFTGEFFWLRAFSVLCGVAAVVGVWAVARSLGSGDPPSDPAATVDGGSTSPTSAASTGSATSMASSRAVAAGFVAAFVLAFAPGPVQLSQVIRPYALQLALLAWALFFLLRYLEKPTSRGLAAYLTLACLAILTHYSSVLALGVFVLVALSAGREGGFAQRPWRRLAMWHALPFGVVATLYVVHLRPLAASALADEALDGWLSYFMIQRPADVWWSLLGLQHHLAGPWLRGPMAIFLLAALGLAAYLRERRVLAVAGGALLIAGVAAALGLYPVGATRHSAWLMVFTVPALGWLGARLLDLRPPPRGRTALMVVAALVALGGPVGSVMGTRWSRWAPTERVLRDVYMRAMLQELSPSGEPKLMVMSAQTFYLLLPFYPAQRERAVFSADSAAFHFPYGDREILVNRAWDFETLSGGPSPTDLRSFLRSASSEFGDLAIDDRDRMMLLLGGWGLPLVEQIRQAPDPASLVRSSRTVPGLHAFVLETGRVLGAAP